MSENVTTTPWYRKHLRVVHTILRTIDAPGYDADAYVKHCLRLNGNALVINAGGLLAFYPTDVPGHVRVPGLESDILGEVVEAAHASGLKVIARVDFRAGHPETFEQHPDWFARDEDGTPVKIRSAMHTAPLTSPYRNEGFAFPVIDEVLSRYDVDAIWENAPSFVTGDPDDHRPVHPYSVAEVGELGAEAASWGLVDYSRFTRERFRADTGLELPSRANFDLNTYATYLAWRGRVATEHTRAIRDVIKAHGDIAFVSEGPTALDFTWDHHSGLELADMAPLWDIVTAPTFDLIRGSRGSPYFPSVVWRPEESAKLLRSFSGGHVPTIMFGRFDNHSRYTTVGPEALALWLAGGIANGAGAWECTFVGRETAEFLDQRTDDIVQKYYGIMEVLGDDLDHGRQVADVAVVHSQETERWFGSSLPESDDYVQHVRGAISTLFESHIPFDTVSTAQIDLETLKRFRVVILANTALLSDENCAVLREYVAQGGGLVATYQTSRFDESGRRREEFGLADVFGVESAPRPAADLVGPLRYAYSRITERGALSEGLEKTEVVTTEGFVEPVNARPDRTVAFRLIESVKPQPPEFGWIEDMSGDLPMVVYGSSDEGRVVYFTSQLDKNIIASGHPDYSQVLVNAVDWAADRPRLVRTDAPASVHVNVMGRSDRASLLVHLVNYSSGPARPIRDIVPCVDLHVSVRWDADTDPLSVTDRLTGASLDFELRDGSVHFVLDKLEVHAAIAIG